MRFVNGPTLHPGEPSAQTRTQGGQLDIHENDGQLALEAAGLTDEFRAIIHEGGAALCVLDRDGTTPSPSTLAPLSSRRICTTPTPSHQNAAAEDAASLV